MEVFRFARFVAVGASNTALSLAVYAALLAGSAPYRPAAAVAFAAGAVNGYVWNRSWTFAARDSGAARLRYAAVQTCGMCASSGLVWLAVGAGSGPLAACVFALPPIAVATFLANRGWTFRPRVAA